MRKCNCPGGDLRRLWSRLGNHCVARNQRSRDLAEKDCEREIPGCDAGPDAAALIAQNIAFAGWPRKDDRCKAIARLLRIVSTEIDGLADFAKCIGNRLFRLIYRDRHELGPVGFEEVCQFFESVRPNFQRRFGPGGKCRDSPIDGAPRVFLPMGRISSFALT